MVRVNFSRVVNWGMLDKLRADTSYAIFELKDGILCCWLKPDLIVDLRTAEKINAQRLRLIKDATFPTLIVVHKNYLHLEKTAFNFFGSPEGLQQVSALGMVIQQPLRTVLTNFSMLFHRQAVPLRLFLNRAEARLWLFEYVDMELSSEPES